MSMTEVEARALGSWSGRSRLTRLVVVDGEDVVVEGHTDHGVFTLWDEADWEWLKPGLSTGSQLQAVSRLAMMYTWHRLRN